MVESRASEDLPPVLYSPQEKNLSATLGETVELRCTVLGYRPARHSVSWTRTISSSHLPEALTFGTKVGKLGLSARIRIQRHFDLLEEVLSSDTMDIGYFILTRSYSF